jgi:hypothetical protein
VARPAEAKALIEALAEPDRALWATALYAGLRRGELRALRGSDVDFEQGVIRVERSWDDRIGPIEPKSRAGRRRVPLTRALRARLAAHRLLLAHGAEDLVFEGPRGGAFCSGAATRRARAAWQEAKLEPIGLHECRHTYAAFMIAAGVNAKALSTYMGHSTSVRRSSSRLERNNRLTPGDLSIGQTVTHIKRVAIAVWCAHGVPAGSGLSLPRLVSDAEMNEAEAHWRQERVRDSDSGRSPFGYPANAVPQTLSHSNKKSPPGKKSPPSSVSGPIASE